MGKEQEGMPFVPEEDLDLHEDFQPIIAENGLIRQVPPSQEQVPQETDLAGLTFTSLDTVQDLIQIRSAEKKLPDTELPPPVAQPATSPATPPAASTQDKKAAPLPHEEKNVPQEQIKKDKKKRAQPSVSPDPAPSLKDKDEKKLPHKGKDGPQGQMRGDKQQPPSFTPPVKSASSRKSHRWVWALGIVCFLFLGTITGVVPVEKIPLLRNLAYAMGFSKNDTMRMSFLRALLTWTDKQVRFSDYLNDDSRTALLARMGETQNELEPDNVQLPSIYARAERTGGKTSLIDVGALTAMQRQKGYKQDNDVRGAAQPLPGQEGNMSASVRDGDVTARTEANQDKSDVFFGSDASAINRNTQDGYDSSKTLAKLANPYIVNGKPIDWLTTTAQRMINANTGLGGLNKELSSVQVNWGGAVQDKGPQKPHRDLYHAWITSRMAKHTQNVMLKKALAEAGFWDGEIPTSASGSLVYGGLQVDIEALQEDQENWDEYLKFEKQCKDALSISMTQINQAFADFDKTVSQSAENLGFPGNCYDARNQGSTPSNTFTSNSNTVSDACSSVQKGYERLATACQMDVSQRINCNDLSGSYSNAYKNFYDECDNFYNEEKKKWEDTYREANPGKEPPSNEFEEKWKEIGKAKDRFEEDGIATLGYAAVIAQMTKDKGNFATWIQGDECWEKDGAYYCTATDQEKDKAKDMIKNHLLKI